MRNGYEWNSIEFRYCSRIVVWCHRRDGRDDEGGIPLVMGYPEAVELAKTIMGAWHARRSEIAMQRRARVEKRRERGT